MTGLLRAAALTSMVLTAACASQPSRPAPARPDFDAARLFAETEALLDVPRTLGDPERTTGIDALRARLEDEGATVQLQPLQAIDPGSGTTHHLTNLYAQIRPQAPRQFVIATHFDIRPWAESDPDPSRRAQPIPGANDGTSGVVVALALLGALRDGLPETVGFTVVLFDGEELGRPGAGGYCAGSRHLAEHPEQSPAATRRAEFGIVLDMVGDADLMIAHEANSAKQHPTLDAHLWRTAASLGARAFVDAAYPRAIIDDHVFLSRAGIPSVLLIDYDYDAWHTHADTLDRVSGESLATVATVVFEAVRTWFEPTNASMQ